VDQKEGRAEQVRPPHKANHKKAFRKTHRLKKKRESSFVVTNAPCFQVEAAHTVIERPTGGEGKKREGSRAPPMLYEKKNEQTARGCSL